MLFRKKESQQWDQVVMRAPGGDSEFESLPLRFSTVEGREHTLRKAMR